MKTLTKLAAAALLIFTPIVAEASPFRSSPRGPSGFHSPRGPSHSSGYRHRAPSRHQRVEVQAQLRLRQLGYYRGPIDGSFGRYSRYALIRFQRDHRLHATGRLDYRTLRALRIVRR